MRPLEPEVRGILARLTDESERLVQDGALSMEAVRRAMARRRLETLRTNRATLKAVQRRAIDLMRRVDVSGRLDADLVPVANADMPVWLYLRHIISSAPWNSRPGRAMYWFGVDHRSRGLVGVVDLGSDLHALGPRDAFLGWTRDQKYTARGLSHLVNLGTCVATQPFGWLTGGKFLAVAATSERVVDAWKRRYGQILAAVTTTSLYGKSSQYNRLDEYRYLGTTSGGGIYQLSATDYRTLKAFLAVNRILVRETMRGGHYNSRMETLQRVCAEFDVDPRTISSHQPRGVYLALLGPDAPAFLRGELATFTPTRRPMSTINEWWHSRWAEMRRPKMADAIARFDWSTYEVDSQIDLARAMSDRSREGAAPLPSGEDGSTPFRSLQTSSAP